MEVENHNVAGNTFTYGYGLDSDGNRYEITYPDGTIVTYALISRIARIRRSRSSSRGPNRPLSVGRRAQSLARLRMKGLAAPSRGSIRACRASDQGSVTRRPSCRPGGTATTPGRRVQQPPSLGRTATTEPAGATRRAASIRPRQHRRRFGGICAVRTNHLGRIRQRYDANDIL